MRLLKAQGAELIEAADALAGAIAATRSGGVFETWVHTAFPALNLDISRITPTPGEPGILSSAPHRCRSVARSQNPQPRRSFMSTRTRFWALGLAAAGLVLSSTVLSQGARTPSPPGAKVYFISPADGAVVKGPVRVVMGLAGMGVAPAGVDIANTGHHHILVNAPANIKFDEALVADATFRHFGLGQTEATLTLPPGRHTLQLLLGDKGHVPHDPPVISEKITITVQP